MKKEFQYMNRDEKIKLLQKTAESFVDKESYTRQKFIGLFDFKNYTMRSENVLSKCKEVLAEKILSLNPDYTLESEKVQEHINDSIEKNNEGNNASSSIQNCISSKIKFH